MFAPVPDEPVFTVERRIVNADVPRFLEEMPRRFLRDLFSTDFAVLVGGRGGGGGGTGSGILGALGDIHIVNLWLEYFRSGFYFVQ